MDTLKRLFFLLTFLFVLVGSVRATESPAPKTLPQDVAAQFGDLYVLYNGRICPLQTVAKDFTVKLYGQPTYRGLTSEQVFTGWMFFYTHWKCQPMIKIKDASTRQKLGIEGKYAALDDFYDPHNAYKNVGDKQADDKFNLISMLYAGQLLTIFPHRAADGSLQWLSQGDALPQAMPDDKWFFIKKSLDYVHEKVVLKDYAEVSRLLSGIRAYQRKEAGDVLPSSMRFEAEKLYNRCGSRWLAMVSLFVGLLSFVYYCVRMAKNQPVPRMLRWPLNVLAVLAFGYLSAVIGLRGYVGGHWPLSSGFETMQFMAWCAFGLIFLLQRKFTLMMPFGFLLGGLTLLVAMMGESNPQITPLMPVLKSPLLCIHVVVIMLAYALLAFVMLNGVVAVCFRYSGRACGEAVDRLQVISRILLYPAVFCLAAGIFIGAVWANISWGRYWGWDPKEVWALVTLLVYSLALHTRSLPMFRRPMVFHVFAISAFFCVLITYFGVNFLLGGMHSYA